MLNNTKKYGTMNEQMANSNIVMQMIKKDQFWILKLKSKISEIKVKCLGIIAYACRKKN